MNILGESLDGQRPDGEINKSVHSCADAEDLENTQEAFMNSLKADSLQAGAVAPEMQRLESADIYTVIASDPRATTFADSDAMRVNQLPKVLSDLVKKCIRTGEKLAVLIPDTGHRNNILRNLAGERVKNLKSKKRKKRRAALMQDPELINSAVAESRLFAIKDKLMIEAMLQQIAEENGVDDFDGEVFLMSKTIEKDARYQSLVSCITELFNANERAREIILDSMPDSLRARVAHDPQYTICELAVNIRLAELDVPVKKYGPETETAWDNATEQLVLEFGELLDVQAESEGSFKVPVQYVDPKGTRNVYYSSQRVDQTIRDGGDAFSVWTDLFLNDRSVGGCALEVFFMFFEKLKVCEELQPEERKLMKEVVIRNMFNHFESEFQEVIPDDSGRQTMQMVEGVPGESSLALRIRRGFFSIVGSSQAFFGPPSDSGATNHIGWGSSAISYSRMMYILYWVLEERPMDDCLQKDSYLAGMLMAEKMDW